MGIILGMLGSIWPTLVAIAAGIGALLFIFLGVKKSGKDEQKVKDQEEAIKNDQALDTRIDKARDAADTVRDSIDHSSSVRLPIPGDKYDRAGRGPHS